MRIAYKYRGVLYLSLLLVVLPWVAVRYALKDTVSAWWECRALQKEVVRGAVAAPADTVAFENGRLLDGQLLSALQPVAAGQRVTVSDYKPLVTLRAEGIEVHTAALVLGGTYRDILQVVQHLERRIKVSSLRFTAITPPNRGSKRLEATVYVEQIIQR